MPNAAFGHLVLRLIFAAATVTWMVFIFQVSSLSANEINQSDHAFLWLGQLRDILGHMMIYAILAALLLMSIFSWRPFPDGFFRWGIVAVVLSVLYGISDEYHQSTVTGRAGSISDVIIDGGGAVMGVLLVKLALANVNRPRKWLGLQSE